jgi:hypothetical protein
MIPLVMEDRLHGLVGQKCMTNRLRSAILSLLRLGKKKRCEDRKTTSTLSSDALHHISALFDWDIDHTFLNHDRLHLCGIY